MRLLSPEELLDLVEVVAADGYCADIAEIARGELFNLSPPEKISTVECAEKYRLVRGTEGKSKVRYDRWRNPYNVGAMNDLDDPACNLVVMVKPSRSGGTTVAENYLFKMMKFGPMGDVGWYLGSDDAVKKYCDRVIKPLFEDHPDIEARIGNGRSDNNDTSKRISGHLVEWLAANDGNFRNREFIFGVMDEPDGWAKKFSDAPAVELKGRQKQLGGRAKGIIMSHPDKGWKAGVANAWETTSRGIYIMKCVECDNHAAAHATKFWPDVPEFKLYYQRCPDEHPDARLAMAEATAGMACPHCGSILTDEQRFAMVDAGEWMHRGQTLDSEAGIQGERTLMNERGYWVHGLMLKVSPAKELASDLEEALMKFERAGGRNSNQLRAFFSKQLGEIFEGKAAMAGASAAALAKRSKEGFTVGTCPGEVMFITSAIDVGAGKFDLSFRGWDLEGRSWLLDRFTRKQRKWPDGIERDIRTRERIEDWNLLIDAAITRTFPIIGREGWAMPVALIVIDVGDGNVTWKGREFARRMLQAGHYWGPSNNPYAKVRTIQGAASAKATELPEKLTPIDKDERGNPFKPMILEASLGVHKLKELAVERLGIDDGGPGQCFFADGIGFNFFDEYFNERLIDGKWERNGPNESLDLFAYEEAARLMLRPDRQDLWRNGARPSWAKPVRMTTEDDADEPCTAPDAPSKPKTKSIFERFDALNQTDEDR